VTGSPFEIKIWSKNLALKGFIGNPLEVEAHPRHMGIGTCVVTVPETHLRLGPSIDTGARMTVDYEGQQILSGPIRNPVSTMVDGVRCVQLGMQDDLRLLWRLLGWPTPSAALTTQTATAYDRKTGSPETVLKWFASRNVARLAGAPGPPITVAPDQARGTGLATVQLRMQPLADQLLPWLGPNSGIGASVRQGATGLVLDCYETAWYPHELSGASGIVDDFEWEIAAPTATRAVIGAQGQGTARAFYEVVDPDLEAAYGDVMEIFVDARDTNDATELLARGRNVLAEAGPTTTIKMSLAETKTFRYGQTIRVGDFVTTRLVPTAPLINALIPEAVIKWTWADGLTVEPVVGEQTNPTLFMVRRLVKLAKAVRAYQTGL